MDAKQLQKYVKREFSSLRTWKPFVETVFCFDTDYDVVDLELIKNMHRDVWAEIGKLPYKPLSRDCDNYARRMATEIQWKYAEDHGRPVAFSEAVGMVPEGMHAFNIAVTEDGLHVFDYGDMGAKENYKPIWARF